jgi:hypothetical protein
MWMQIEKSAGSESEGSGWSTGMRRVRTALATLAVAGVLSACGGGGDSAPPVGNYNFNLNIASGGQLVSDTPVPPGGVLDLSVRVGQPVQLDAREPVTWTLIVGSSVIANGLPISYAGVDMTGTTVTSSAIVLDTYARYALQALVPVTLVATSTYDPSQAVTVRLLITN